MIHFFRPPSKHPKGARLKPVSDEYQTGSRSYMSENQESLYDLLRSNGKVIPTTARDTESLSKLYIDFSDFAITTFGGIILTPEKELDQDWYDVVLEEGRSHHEIMPDLLDEFRIIGEKQGIALRSWIVDDFDHNFYLCFKHNNRDVKALNRLFREHFKENIPQDWQIHFNGNNLAILPPYLNKRRAVEWFIKNRATDALLTIGFGDSLTDLPFMDVCDYALLPTESQLQNLIRKTHVKNSIDSL